jgi:hypothetical protein
LAALGVAIENGLVNCKESVKLAEKSRVPAEGIESQEITKVLPRSCAEAADNLKRDRESYEAGNIFPRRLIDGIIDRLHGYEDRDLCENLISKPEELQTVLDRFLDYGEKENAYSLTYVVNVLKTYFNGRVDQFGMIATLASWRSRVQIPARPPENRVPCR